MGGPRWRARVRAPLGARRSVRARRARMGGGHHPRAPCSRPGHARVSLRALRAGGAEAPDEQVRHARGRRGPDPAREDCSWTCTRSFASRCAPASRATRSRSSSGSTASSARGDAARRRAPCVRAVQLALGRGVPATIDRRRRGRASRRYNRDDCVSTAAPARVAGGAAHRRSRIRASRWRGRAAGGRRAPGGDQRAGASRSGASSTDSLDWCAGRARRRVRPTSRRDGSSPSCSPTIAARRRSPGGSSTGSASCRRRGRCSRNGWRSAELEL